MRENSNIFSLKSTLNVKYPIKLSVKYRVILSIPSDKVNLLSYKSGKGLQMLYDVSDIHVLSVEITDFNTKETRAIFGSEYTSTDVLSLEQIAKNDIKNKVMNKENIDKAEKNLRSFVRDIAFKNNIKEITYNHNV